MDEADGKLFIKYSWLRKENDKYICILCVSTHKLNSFTQVRAFGKLYKLCTFIPLVDQFYIRPIIIKRSLTVLLWICYPLEHGGGGYVLNLSISPSQFVSIMVSLCDTHCSNRNDTIRTMHIV